LKTEVLALKYDIQALHVREGVLRANLERERMADTTEIINFDETIKNLGESIR
jgi:hypothetical protein